MDLNFAAFLEDYIPVMPHSVQDGILKRMTYSENLTKISFYIAFPQLVPVQDLLALGEERESRGEIDGGGAGTVLHGLFCGSGGISETGNDGGKRLY